MTKGPTPTHPHPTARRRRAGVLAVVYLWVAAIFPVLHAAAEQPAAVATAAGQEQPAPGSLPTGHDHLTCHFCATSGTLVTAPATIPADCPEGKLVPQPSPVAPAEPLVLAWTHHAIPPRAPPNG